MKMMINSLFQPVHFSAGCTTVCAASFEAIGNVQCATLEEVFSVALHSVLKCLSSLFTASLFNNCNSFTLLQSAHI